MPEKLNTVPFVSVDHMMKLVLAIGVERFPIELATYIQEADVGSASTRRRVWPRIARKALSS